MGPGHRGKRSVNVRKYRARAFTADNPVLIIFVDNKDEGLEELQAVVPYGAFTVYAFSTGQLLRQNGPALYGNVQVFFRLKEVYFQ